ncbi:UvrD-helicase domain-containing protein [Kineosporia sp. J2-2]|uniref:RecBCD enzyme subunit RecB n=1 Tax=Kineosporia corallincola TaxID=2835133 RepID=A0ABS5T924_9ACTN|nr:UvrD-helicase domain-containing protein [Kineosporia corallincola]MBT0767575.1 UvrD-helicase domain-containing protein [Kineosporia corallincola]
MSAPMTGQQTLRRQQPFDLHGELPRDTTIMLEASAGTGKTFTVAALVTRYVAEGLAENMSDLLVVSFSRESTRELRERVRERLVSARDGLALPDPSMIDPADRVLVHLADVDPARRARRLDRLERALAGFDAATVTTIHGFCQQILTTLGTNGDHDPDTRLLEDVADLVREVADDLYLRKWGGPGAGAPEMSRDEFHRLALDAVAEMAELVPDPSIGGMPGLRARIARAVRAEVDLRKRRQGVFGYDDMLTRLAQTLADPESGPAVCERLRSLYRFVLVDEFQDTDPVQWEIIRRPFHGHSTLVLIGDPKQAVYGFRGADVQAYLNAFETAETVRTLPTSYRSDARLLRGLDAVFRGAALGDERIRVQPVEAFHTGRLVHVEGTEAALRLRVLARDELPQTDGGLARSPRARDAVLADLVAETVRLLSGAARVRPRDGSDERDLRPGDIAVLVRTNYQAQQVNTALGGAGVPVVVTGRTSVFSTPAAHEWKLLLEAMEQPHRTTRVRRLALGCFVGATARELDEDGERIDEELALMLREWGHVLTERGVGALFEIAARRTGLQRRILGTVGGERLLTDLRHVAQTLQEAGETNQLGLTGLLLWLRHRQEEAAGREGALERSRRLESDAAAVQVMTVHTSKGLEFPVVLVPYAWNQWAPKERDISTVTFHEGDRRMRDVGGPGSVDWAGHLAASLQEDADDELRLTYVALTRAQSHLVLWWAPTYNTQLAPLHRILFNPDPEQPAPRRIAVPSDAGALADLERIARRAEGGLTVEPVRTRPATRWRPSAPQPVSLSVATLDRDPEPRWNRTSYSALTESAHERQQALSEPEVTLKNDEGPDDEAPATAGPAAGDPDGALAAIPSAWNELQAGARFGTLVHEVLELAADAGDVDELRTTVAARVARTGPAVDVETLVQALIPAVSTPLGLNQLTLRDISAKDRLSELNFELPMAGGDDPLAGQALLSGLAPVWRRHCPAPQLLHDYADALEELEAVPLRGYLTGSIDAVLRVPGETGPRYVVVDYKTNRLGTPDQPVTAWHYRPQAMAEAMIAAHYPLQALLYGVALHRYLRWRQPGYHPDVHLGGVRYLFLRGMSGPGVLCADGTAPGVFTWQPPTGLITETSDLLAGEA